MLQFRFFQDNGKVKGGGGKKYGGSVGHSRGLEFLFFKVSFHLEYWCLTLKETKAVPIGHRILGSAMYGNPLFGHLDDFKDLARGVADQYLHLHELNTNSTALLLHLYSSYSFHLG